MMSLTCASGSLLAGVHNELFRLLLCDLSALIVVFKRTPFHRGGQSTEILSAVSLVQ